VCYVSDRITWSIVLTLELTCHDVSSRQLLPGLYGEAGNRPAPHAIVHELPPAFESIALSNEDRDDFFVLSNDVRIVDVSSGLNVCENVDSLFGLILHGEPTYTLSVRGPSVQLKLELLRGLSGRKGRPIMKKTHGTNWIDHAVRKESGPAMNEQP